MAGKTVELTGRKRDGTEFPLELSLCAVEMDGHPQYIGSIRDQTERHRMRAMLAHTDKLASIGLLSAGVAHEINNPLAYVLNNLVVLQREVKGLLDLVRLYDSSRTSLEKTEPECLRQIEELEEEIDWPYIRDNLDAMIDRTADRREAGRQHRREDARARPDLASPVGVGLPGRTRGEHAGGDAGPAQA